MSNSFVTLIADLFTRKTPQIPDLLLCVCPRSNNPCFRPSDCDRIFDSSRIAIKSSKQEFWLTNSNIVHTRLYI